MQMEEPEDTPQLLSNKRRRYEDDRGCEDILSGSNKRQRHTGQSNVSREYIGLHAYGQARVVNGNVTMNGNVFVINSGDRHSSIQDIVSDALAGTLSQKQGEAIPKSASLRSESINFIDRCRKLIQHLMSSVPLQIWTRPVRFEDACGRTIPMDIAYIQNWDAFDNILNQAFRHNPGHRGLRRVTDRMYTLHNHENDFSGRPSPFIEFANMIKPGAHVTMSMIFLPEELGDLDESECPSCGCLQASVSGENRCKECTAIYTRNVAHSEIVWKMSDRDDRNRPRNGPQLTNALRDDAYDRPSDFKRISIGAKVPHMNKDKKQPGDVVAAAEDSDDDDYYYIKKVTKRSSGAEDSHTTRKKDTFSYARAAAKNIDDAHGNHDFEVCDSPQSSTSEQSMQSKFIDAGHGTYRPSAS